MELQENIRAGAEEIKERYALVMERIQAMKREQTVSAPFYAYFQKTADFILEVAAYAEGVKEGKPERMTLEELQEVPMRGATRIRRRQYGFLERATASY